MDLSLIVTHKLAEFGVKTSDKLIVAVSGGMDSMLLWETMLSLEYATVGVHINYNLRGEESSKDESLVCAFAKEHDLQLEVFQADPKMFESNLQEKARTFRYQKFDEVKQAHNTNWLLTHFTIIMYYAGTIIKS